MPKLVTAMVVTALLVLTACSGGGRGGESSEPDESTTTTFPCVLAPGASCAGADLSGESLVGHELIEADLSGADLSGADLTGVDLTRADLTGANLRGAILANTHLEATIFEGADLTDADLTDAFAAGTYFDGARLIRTKLTGADVSGTFFNDAKLRDNAIENGSYIGFASGLTLESLSSALGTTPDRLTQTMIDRRMEFIEPDYLADRAEGTCKGMPLPGTAEPSPTAGYHPTTVILLNLDADGYDDGDFTPPRTWSAAAEPLVEYTACVRTNPVEVERCAYQTEGIGTSGGATLYRFRQEVTVRMVAAATGTVVETQTFAGGEPEACPERTGARIGATRLVQSGSWPSEAVLSFVSGYVGTPPPGIPRD